MIIKFHKYFEKQYKKLKRKEQVKVGKRLVLFLEDPFNPLLHNHPLKGKYLDYRSIDISGDLRAVYKFVNSDEAIFIAIGTHSELFL